MFNQAVSCLKPTSTESRLVDKLVAETQVKLPKFEMTKLMRNTIKTELSITELNIAGSGGFGTVYIGKDANKNPISLKMIQAKYQVVPECCKVWLQRINREEFALRQLESHPNVVTLFNRHDIPNALGLFLLFTYYSILLTFTNVPFR